MRLTIKHDGNPARTRIVDADTGAVLEDVRSYSLDRPDMEGCEVLTIQVFILPPDNFHPAGWAQPPAVREQSASEDQSDE